MRVEQLWIAGRLPGLNDLLEWRAAPPVTRRVRGRSVPIRIRNPEYHDQKAHWASIIRLLVQHAHVGAWPSGAHFTYAWREESRRRDPSNFCAGGQKFIEDGLVECGVLPNDGWKHVLSVTHTWAVGKSAGVMVTLSEHALDLRSTLSDVAQIGG